MTFAYLTISIKTGFLYYTSSYLMTFSIQFISIFCFDHTFRENPNLHDKVY